jgi:hypothetical protein
LNWYLHAFSIQLSHHATLSSFWSFLGNHHFSSLVKNSMLAGAAIILHQLWRIRNAALRGSETLCCCY